MLMEWMTQLIADYQRVLEAKILLLASLLVGSFISLLILVFILIHLYPAYAWCVLGGFLVLWFFCSLSLYVYLKIARAQRRSNLSAVHSIEYYLGILVSTLISFINSRRKSKK